MGAVAGGTTKLMEVEAEASAAAAVVAPAVVPEAEASVLAGEAMLAVAA